MVLNRHTKVAIDKVTEWLQEHHLDLAPEKTEAIVLKGPRKREAIRVMVGQHRIAPKKEAKYLGIVIDGHGYFGPQVKFAVQKAEMQVAALAKIMPNCGGPSSSKRAVVLSVVHSTLLYGAQVWYPALRVKKYRGMLEATQRRILLRVASAYRTVSASAVQAITGTMPMHLMVEERRRIADIPPPGPSPMERKRIRKELVQEWQQEWAQNIEKAQWTKQLIPDLTEWVKCTHKKLDYFLTQFLTGHGSFGTFTRRIGKKETDDCRYCEINCGEPK